MTDPRTNDGGQLTRAQVARIRAQAARCALQGQRGDWRVRLAREHNISQRTLADLLAWWQGNKEKE